MTLTFVELPQFTEQLNDLAEDEDYQRLQTQLLADPDRGDLIPQSGGLRKVRMAIAGRGKRGGARVIYLYLAHLRVIICFYMYTKTKSENLTFEQLKRLREAVKIIKHEYSL